MIVHMTALNEWENFYLIVGPSAGVLIGLQFVVITLIADGPMTRGDWLFHFLLPFAAYALLAVSAYTAQFYVRPALFLVGAATLLLLFIGIHNAWDAVMYHVFVRSRYEGKFASSALWLRVDEWGSCNDLHMFWT
jgi:hypothetical protein